MAGRPQIQIDKNQFEKLCELQCTKAEIAGWFACSEDTIERWCKRTYGLNFAAVFAQKREKGKISLRRTMVALSQKNASVAIFLAKNWLGMSDKQEIKMETANDATAQRMEDFFAAKKANENANGRTTA